MVSYAEQQWQSTDFCTASLLLKLMNLFNVILVNPIINILVAMYHLLIFANNPRMGYELFRSVTWETSCRIIISCWTACFASPCAYWSFSIHSIKNDDSRTRSDNTIQ